MKYIKSTGWFGAVHSLTALIVALPLVAHASVDIGSGFNSTTDGRIVPSLNLGYEGKSMATLFSSTGVATKAYYNSAYTLGFYWTWAAGDFLGGKINAGFGAGFLYSEKGFQDSGAAAQTKDDFTGGPAFFASWQVIGPFFTTVEAIYGFGDPSKHLGDMLAMNFRDHINFIAGLRF